MRDGPKRLFASTLTFCFLAALAALPGAAAERHCLPCAGVVTTSPDALLPFLATPPRLEKNDVLYLAWPVDLSAMDAETGRVAHEAARHRFTPWLKLGFNATPPLKGSATLETELARVAEIAGEMPSGTRFEIDWRSGTLTPDETSDYAYLLKRAAVAISGAANEGKVVSEPLPADPGLLARLYAEDIGAYVDLIALAPSTASAESSALAKLTELDPGKPVALDALPFPKAPDEVLADAARSGTAGFAVTLFAAPPQESAVLAPLKVLAREFAGDLSPDPDSAPGGPEGTESWAFVRGKDLGLRVVVANAGKPGELQLAFDDPQLRRPSKVDLKSGADTPVFDFQPRRDGLGVTLQRPAAVTLLRLDRATAAELKGEAGEVTVTRAKEMPVTEILRRLQAFEDNQERRLDHYQAVNTTYLRFHIGASSQTVEATFKGAFFYSQGKGFDWAWQHFLINGVRWRGKKIPEIPLIQPEKAAAMPLAIHFSKRYSYRLRGSERVDGRDCWVVDFQPTSSASAEKGRLYRGTVWIDKQVYARVKIRALQLGLTGDVLSNDETTLYSPVDRQGRPAPWSRASYVLPLKVLGQQILSILNATTVVEKETLLTQVIVNGSDFSARRDQVLSSDSTMVHDTSKGLRYLVKEGYKKTKLFALGGAFYDSSLSYPLPLAGINYLSFDFRGTGNQLNVFFAGALLTANLAQPHLFGSNFDFGGDVFALGINGTDNYYQTKREDPAQEIEVRPASASLKIGHPLGSFTKVNLTYQLDYDHYQRSSNTAAGFIVPASHFTHSLALNLDFSRSGYGLGASVSRNRRSRWTPWGFAGNLDYSPDKRDFTKWGALASKNWYLSKFQRVSAEVDYNGGSNLDRFSKYSFGFFSPTRVHGYPSNRVRASEVEAAHLSYGFEIGQLFRLDLVGDAAWATDKETDLKHQLLAGTGLVGTFMGPWQTVVNLDVGFPVAGPADGVVAYVVFLKLFR